MDWRLFEQVNGFFAGHHLLAQVAADVGRWSVLAFAVATLALWFVGRPGVVSSTRLASVSALTAAALALGTNQVISHLWARPRPADAHPGLAHLLFVSPSGDPSFPSDHAAAAVAIALATFVYTRRAGVILLAGAALVMVSRVAVGLHYPSDVVGGAVVGAVASLVVTKLLHRPVEYVAEAAGRLTDPLLARVWRLRVAHRA